METHRDTFYMVRTMPYPDIKTVTLHCFFRFQCRRSLQCCRGKHLPGLKVVERTNTPSFVLDP
jgi:hypothetical protein